MTSLIAKMTELKPVFTLVYLSLMGFLCATAAQVYMGLEFNPAPTLCFMGVIFGIYTFNRFTDVQEDFTTDIGRLLFFQGKKGYLFIALACLVGSTAFLHGADKLNWMHVLLVAVGFVYSYRLIPWYSQKEGVHFIRIKEMTFVKNLAVSFLWGAAVFLVPALYSGQDIDNAFTVTLLACGLCLATFNNTLYDDIQDMAGDRVAGIKTLPTVIGEGKSVRLLWVLDAVWLAVISSLALAGWLELRHFAFLSLMAAYPIVYIVLDRAGRLPKGWLDFVGESDLLVFSLGLALLSRIA